MGLKASDNRLIPEVLILVGCCLIAIFLLRLALVIRTSIANNQIIEMM